MVDTVAPVAALAGGHIAGAALDVSDDRPLLPDSPLWGLPDVLLMRHKAGITEDSMLRMGQTVAEETLRLLAGGLPRPFCNPQVTARDRMRFPA
jgi:D-3-phosphoglycerate dehydrogenase